MFFEGCPTSKLKPQKDKINKCDFERIISIGETRSTSKAYDIQNDIMNKALYHKI